MIFSSLLCDLYELTMADGYFREHTYNKEAIFKISFRTNPFGGDYALAAGLEEVVNVLRNFSFKEEDISYLRGLKKTDGTPLFAETFLTELAKFNFSGSLWMVEEGEVIFAKEPFLIVKGPLWECQILETILLNAVSFATLVATKASRIVLKANKKEVIEFGLRRAQGKSGGLIASRSAYIGGFSGTSNVLAGKLYGIPVKGTIAHSWVMAYESEYEAFQKAADIMGNGTILVLDTYSTIFGLENAIKVGHELEKKGQKLLGVRLDSGDIAELSRVVRNALDKEGFTYTKILASGDLDEYLINKFEMANVPVDVWCVGTKLATCYDMPAIDMTYKLVALQNEKNGWDYKIKISDQFEKTTTTGFQQIRRFEQNNQYLYDVIYDRNLGLSEGDYFSIIQNHDVLKLVFDQGKLCYALPELADIQKKALANLAKLPTNNLIYPVQLDKNLEELQATLLAEQKVY